MSRTVNPTLITLALSVAAVLGYVTYRFTLGDDAGHASQAAHDAAEQGNHDAHAEGPRLADALPDFSLADLDGEMHSFHEWAGQPLVVNFWATWCEPCRREIPMLKAFHDDHPAITVLGIAVERPDPVREYAATADFNYPILVGQQDGIEAATRFGVELYAMPVTIFTDAAGRTLGSRMGELHAEHLDEVLTALEGIEAGRFDLEQARAYLAERM